MLVWLKETPKLRVKQLWQDGAKQLRSVSFIFYALRKILYLFFSYFLPWQFAFIFLKFIVDKSSISERVYRYMKYIYYYSAFRRGTGIQKRSCSLLKLTPTVLLNAKESGTDCFQTLEEAKSPSAMTWSVLEMRRLIHAQVWLRLYFIFTNESI